MCWTRRNLVVDALGWVLSVMIVSLLIFILPYSQPSHSSYHTLFVIFMLLTANMIHKASTILHQSHFDMKIYYSRVCDSLDSRPSYDIHVSLLMFDSITSICCNPKYYTVRQTLFPSLSIVAFMKISKYDCHCCVRYILWKQSGSFVANLH